MNPNRLDTDMQPSSDYSAIKRYDLAKDLLRNLSRRAMMRNGWAIREENTASLVAAVPHPEGLRDPIVTVQIPGNFLFVKCESGSPLEDYWRNKDLVKSFFKALEEELQGNS